MLRISLQSHSTVCIFLRPKKKNCYVALTRPKSENWVGRSIFFFFFFFFFTYRERVEFSNIILKVSKWENSGGMQSKRIYKCFFKPLNTNFSKFFAQIWHFQKKKKKKPDPVFSHLCRSGEGNIIFFFLALCNWDTRNVTNWVPYMELPNSKIFVLPGNNFPPQIWLAISADG